MLSILSLDHARSSIAARERFALAEEERARLGGIVRRACGCQVAFLTTCNRVELILWRDPAREHDASPADSGSILGGIRAVGRRLAPAVTDHFIDAASAHHDADAVRHLFRVTAGLESQVEGDVQVLGQVRAAYAAAAEAGGLGPELHRIFQTALRAGKRVHHETAFGVRRATVGTAAAQVVASRLTHDAAPSVVLLGAGKAAEAAAGALLPIGASLTIVNRDQPRAEAFTRARGGVVRPFAERHAAVASADAAILATGAQEPVLTVQEFREARAAAGRSGRPLLILDLGFPRNAEPALAAFDGVTLIGLQDLPGHDPASAASRAEAERIVAEETHSIRSWLEARSIRLAGAA